MRQYEKTHPWLTFTLDTRSLDFSVWILLGEAQSKCEHIAGVPLRPSVAQELHEVYLAKGALATTAIEGNTLSESEVRQHLAGKLKLPPSKDYLTQEIDNIIEACHLIAKQIFLKDEAEISLDKIKIYNKLVLKDLPYNSDAMPGEIRHVSVGVGRYRAAPAEDCEYLTQRLCEWLNSMELPQENRIAFGVLKAIVAHLYFVWIHPFGDGNGRTARLIEFQTLLELGIPSPAAHLLSNHYNQTRSEYYRQLDMASKTNGDIRNFIKYALQGFVDQLRSQIEIIRIQQWDVTWRNFVHEKFKDQTTESGIRQRHLALDLSRLKEPVRLSKITEISPRLAAAYATKTKKTLSRDINKLRSMELVKVTKRGIQANCDIILAFLPSRRFIDEGE